MSTTTIALATQDPEVIGSFETIIGMEKNWSLRVYANGDSLLDKLENAFDILLLDTNINSTSVVHLIKEIHSGTTEVSFPIVVLSERVKSFNFLGYVTAGADEFIRRPFDPYICLARIKSLLRARQRATKLRTKELIMRIVARQLAHDLAGPLMTIQYHNAKMAKTKTFDDKASDRIDDATKTLMKMLHLSKKTLSGDEKSQQGGEWLPLRSSVDELEAMFADPLASKELRLQFPSHQELDQFEIFCEPTVFQYSIFANILSNAIKFSDRGKSIQLTTRWEPPESLVVSITNEGPSISQQQADIINKQLATSSLTGTEGESGTGFGLSIVNFYCQEFGGQMSIHPAPQGTTVEVVIRCRQLKSLS